MTYLKIEVQDDNTSQSSISMEGNKVLLVEALARAILASDDVSEIIVDAMELVVSEARHILSEKIKVSDVSNAGE